MSPADWLLLVCIGVLAIIAGLQAVRIGDLERWRDQHDGQGSGRRYT